MDDANGLDVPLSINQTMASRSELHVQHDDGSVSKSTILSTSLAAASQQHKNRRRGKKKKQSQEAVQGDGSPSDDESPAKNDLSTASSQIMNRSSTTSDVKKLVVTTRGSSNTGRDRNEPIESVILQRAKQSISNTDSNWDRVQATSKVIGDHDSDSEDATQLDTSGQSRRRRRRRHIHHNSTASSDPSTQQLAEPTKKVRSLETPLASASASPSSWGQTMIWHQPPPLQLRGGDAEAFPWDPALASIVDRTANDPWSMESLVQNLAAALPEISLEARRNQSLYDYDYENALDASLDSYSIGGPQTGAEDEPQAMWGDSGAFDPTAIEVLLQSPHPAAAAVRNTPRMWGSTSSLANLSLAVAAAAVEDDEDEIGGKRGNGKRESWQEWDPDREQRVAQVVEMAEEERQRRISEREASTWRDRVDRAARIEWAVLAYKRHQQSKSVLAATSSPSFASFSSSSPVAMPSSPSGGQSRSLRDMSPIPNYGIDYEVICPYSVLGCDVTLSRSELPKHLEECSFRAEVMEAKRQAQFRETYNPLDHVVVCPYTVVGCNHECRRVDLPAHLQICAFKSERGSTNQNSPYEVVCPNATLGCGYSCLRSQIPFHLQECRFRIKSQEEEEEERDANRQFAIEAEEEERSRRVSSLGVESSEIRPEDKQRLHNQLMNSSSSSALRHVEQPTNEPFSTQAALPQNNPNSILLKRRDKTDSLPSGPPLVQSFAVQATSPKPSTVRSQVVFFNAAIKSRAGSTNHDVSSKSRALGAANKQRENREAAATRWIPPPMPSGGFPILPPMPGDRARSGSTTGIERSRGSTVSSVGGGVEKARTNSMESPPLDMSRMRISNPIGGHQGDRARTNSSGGYHVSNMPNGDKSRTSSTGGLDILPPTEIMRRSSTSHVSSPLGNAEGVRLVRSASLSLPIGPSGDESELMRSRRVSWVMQAAEIERLRMNEEIIAKTTARRSGGPASPPPSPNSRKSASSKDEQQMDDDPSFPGRRKALLENALRRQKLHNATWYPAAELAFQGRRTHVHMFHMHMEQQMRLLFQALSDEIETFGRDCALWERQCQLKVAALVSKIESTVVRTWTKFVSKNPPSVQMFGSFASELSVPGVSDLDLVVVPGEDPTTGTAAPEPAPGKSPSTTVNTNGALMQSPSRLSATRSASAPSPPNSRANAMTRSRSPSVLDEQRSAISQSPNRSTSKSVAPMTNAHGTRAVSNKPSRSASIDSTSSSMQQTSSLSLIARLRQGPTPESETYIRNLMRDRLEAARRCHILGEALKECTFIQNVKVIDTALVPIISMETLEVPPRLDIDLTIALTNHDGIAAAEFVRMLRLRFPPLMPMVRLLKAFLHSRNLANPFHGGLPSYALVLMATSSIIRSCSRSGSTRQATALSQGELILDFLDLFGREFDYKMDAVCCNWKADLDKLGMGRGFYAEVPLLRVSKRSESLSGNIETVLVVDDPIRFGNNVGRSCYAFHQVQQAFAEVLANLLQQVVKNEALSRNAKSGFGSSGFLLERVFGVKSLYKPDASPVQSMPTTQSTNVAKEESPQKSE